MRYSRGKKGTPEPDDPFALAPIRGPAHPSSLSPDAAARLGGDYERAQEHHRTADAESTIEGYAHDWAKFEGYCRERGQVPLPAHPELVASYLTWLAETAVNALRGGRVGYKPATLQRARAAIAAQHRTANLPSPCGDDRVKRVMKSIKKSKGSSQRRAWPIMPEHLRAILAWIGGRGKPVRDVRDRAILLACWAGGLRREELVALRRGDVRLHEGNVVFFVQRSKTDQAGKGAYVDFTRDPDLGEACPIRGLRAWVELSAEPAGEHFIRRVVGEAIGAQPISDKKVDRLVRAGARAIGLDPRKYSAHSLRAGVATYLIHVVRMNPFDVKKHLRHKSVAMLDIYVRDWDELPNGREGET